MGFVSRGIIGLALVFAAPTHGATQDTKKTTSSRFLTNFRDQVARCLYVPYGARREKVRIGIRFERDGSLAQPPKALGQQPPSDMAQVFMRAVRRCAPYRFPADLDASYENWKHVEIEFDAWRH